MKDPGNAEQKDAKGGDFNEPLRNVFDVRSARGPGGQGDESSLVLTAGNSTSSSESGSSSKRVCLGYPHLLLWMRCVVCVI